MTKYSELTISSQRFGLGFQPEQRKHIAQIGFREWLYQQTKPNTYYIDPAIKDLPDSSEILTAALKLQKSKQQVKKTDKQVIQQEIKKTSKELYLRQIHARHQQQINTPFDFQERLIRFWTNHFAISANGAKMQAIAGTIENEVIRPHVNNNFSDMLSAVIKHPAMLMYLDNVKSFGPDSKRGIKNQKGLNENLAREILELHTLGVNGGYTQNDIINLSKAITGWSVKPNNQGIVTFKFISAAHQPEKIELLGKKYNQKGLKKGEACLKDLACSPATALYISEKLSQHFIGEHDLVLINKLKMSFLANNGNLPDLYKIIIEYPKCWQTTQLRFRTPQEWLIALHRSLKSTPKKKQLNQQLNVLAQPSYKSGSPAGWPDQDSDYNSSSGLIQRWQIADQTASFLIKQSKTDSRDLLDKVINTLYQNPKFR